MKTVVILGTDELIYNAADLLNPANHKLIGFATTDEKYWNIYDADGSIKEKQDTMPVMPVDMISGYDPDVVLVAATNEDKNSALKYMIYRTGFQNEVIFYKDIFDGFSARTSVIRRLSYRLNGLGIPGSAAELGCGKGDFAWQINALMPTRKLYLFDTFTGFNPRDIAKEQELKLSSSEAGELSFADTDKLMDRMPNPEQVEIRKGWFPETAEELESETFAFVCIDACLYQPTFSGLQFFYPRMSRGGLIMLCGCEDPLFPGVQRALQDIEEKYGVLFLTPVGDIKGTVMIIHP